MHAVATRLIANQEDAEHLRARWRVDLKSWLEGSVGALPVRGLATGGAGDSSGFSVKLLFSLSC